MSKSHCGGHDSSCDSEDEGSSDSSEQEKEETKNEEHKSFAKANKIDLCRSCTMGDKMCRTCTDKVVRAQSQQQPLNKSQNLKNKMLRAFAQQNEDSSF